MNSGNGHMMENEIRAKLLLSDDDLLAEVGQSLGKGATFTDALKRGRLPGRRQPTSRTQHRRLLQYTRPVAVLPGIQVRRCCDRRRHC